ncbi:MAG TPA: isochorismatase family protein [Beijerinckiaceae bacterium]|nr:isochorismatase family protein [Beijerinckiaceae bacterium]
MPLIDRSGCRLILIDLQERLLPAIEGGAVAVENARRLAEAATRLDVPIIRTEHYPKGLGTTVAPLAGYGRMIEKITFNSCGEPAFVEAVAGAASLVVAGCETHVCLLQTVLGLLARGHRVHVVEDAAGSRTGESKRAALRRMRREGAEIVTTEMVIFEWLVRGDHPAFKPVSALIRTLP